MKKLSMYFLALITVCFVLPAIFTKTNKQVSTDTQGENISIDVQNIEEQKDSNNSDKEIKLLHSKTGEVENVNIEEYLCNVVSAEMPASFETEALKAQAIVARTYTMFKLNNKKHDNADICDNSTCCQAWISKEDRLAKWEESKRDEYWQKICSVVQQTKGQVIMYNNEPINGFFHSNSGGTTEIPVNGWGGTNYPYLQVVETSGEEAYTQYASEVTIANTDIINKLKEKYQDISIDFSKVEDLKIVEHTESGRVKTVKFGNHKLSGVEVRSIFGLKSTNFEILKIDNDHIQFKVKGYGHGVGMSQTGADSLAKQGKTAEEIIHHFYSNVNVKKIY